MWNEAGGGICKAHLTPDQTQSAGAQFNANENLNGIHLKKLQHSLFNQFLRDKTSMDEASNGSFHLFKMSTGMEGRVGVPALCFLFVFELPLGATRRPVRSGSLGVYEMLNMLQKSLDEFKRDLGFIKCVYAGGKQFYIQLPVELQI